MVFLRENPSLRRVNRCSLRSMAERDNHESLPAPPPAFSLVTLAATEWTPRDHLAPLVPCYIRSPKKLV